MRGTTQSHIKPRNGQVFKPFRVKGQKNDERRAGQMRQESANHTRNGKRNQDGTNTIAHIKSTQKWANKDMKEYTAVK